jgi:hypothetical protein
MGQAVRPDEGDDLAGESAAGDDQGAPHLSLSRLAGGIAAGPAQAVTRCRLCFRAMKALAVSTATDASRQ